MVNVQYLVFTVEGVFTYCIYFDALATKDTFFY